MPRTKAHAAPMTITEAAESGTRLDELRAMRRRIATCLDDTSTMARDLSSLTRRQMEIGREIADILAVEDKDASVISDEDDEAFDGTTG